MDLSEIYIKMSDHPKIQGQWKLRKLGDWVWYKGLPWHELHMVNQEDMKVNSEFVEKKVANQCIWLPRQDQIQEMGNWAICALTQIITEDVYPKKAEYLQQNFDTWEQLLLAIYMYDEHRLIWNSKKWQKE